MNKVVAIKDMSAGNDSVGEMWKETKIFNAYDPISAVMEWAGKKKNVVLTIPEQEAEDEDRG